MVAVFVLAVFFLFLVIDLIVLKVEGKTHPAFEPQLAQHTIPIFEKEPIAIPANTILSKGHTWFRQNNDGLVSIGIDEFGLNALGALSILSCPENGKLVNRGDILFEATSGNRKVNFLSPVDGIVSTINNETIGKMISDPYKNWGVQLISKDFSENKKIGFSGDDALNWLKKESLKFKTFINNRLPKVEAVGATMFDGWLMTHELVSSLNEINVKEFEKEFLSL
jgi:glycine cleavage system H lipoate-binding protein